MHIWCVNSIKYEYEYLMNSLRTQATLYLETTTSVTGLSRCAMIRLIYITERLIDDALQRRSATFVTVWTPVTAAIATYWPYGRKLWKSNWSCLSETSVDHTFYRTYHVSSSLTLYGHAKTAEQRTVINTATLHGNWYTGRWWVGCYISYSDRSGSTERGRSPPRALLVVPNVTIHPSMASVPTYNYILFDVAPWQPLHSRVKLSIDLYGLLCTYDGCLTS